MGHQVGFRLQHHDSLAIRKFDIPRYLDYGCRTRGRCRGNARSRFLQVEGRKVLSPLPASRMVWSTNIAALTMFANNIVARRISIAGTVHCLQMPVYLLLHRYPCRDRRTSQILSQFTDVDCLRSRSLDGFESNQSPVGRQ